jgi:hypothetical protein
MNQQKGPAMLSRLQRIFWRFVGLISPRSWLERVFRHKLAALRAELEGTITDKFVELLLHGMDVAFVMLASYRRNLRGFRGSYLLRTSDGTVAASAIFDGGRMKVLDSAIASPTVTITFKDPAAFRRFLFSQDQDVLNSLMANEVEVEGNLAYIYKFGYMARDLTLQLGVT